VRRRNLARRRFELIRPHVERGRVDEIAHQEMGLRRREQSGAVKVGGTDQARQRGSGVAVALEAVAFQKPAPDGIAEIGQFALDAIVGLGKHAHEPREFEWVPRLCRVGRAIEDSLQLSR